MSVAADKMKMLLTAGNIKLRSSYYSYTSEMSSRIYVSIIADCYRTHKSCVVSYVSCWQWFFATNVYRIYWLDKLRLSTESIENVSSAVRRLPSAFYTLFDERPGPFRAHDSRKHGQVPSNIPYIF